VKLLPVLKSVVMAFVTLPEVKTVLTAMLIVIPFADAQVIPYPAAPTTVLVESQLIMEEPRLIVSAVPDFFATIVVIN